MDFMVGFPKSVGGSDSIQVVLDKLTKSTHFISIKISYPLQKLVEIYISEIVKLHGIRLRIVSVRNPRFSSMFWKSLQAALGTKLRLSSAYYLQTDG